jgi:hypothetical protein
MDKNPNTGDFQIRELGKMCYTCIATGKSSWKSGGKKRSACFFEKLGFPGNVE